MTSFFFILKEKDSFISNWSNDNLFLEDSNGLEDKDASDFPALSRMTCLSPSLMYRWSIDDLLLTPQTWSGQRYIDIQRDRAMKTKQMRKTAFTLSASHRQGCRKGIPAWLLLQELMTCNWSFMSYIPTNHLSDSNDRKNNKSWLKRNPHWHETVVVLLRRSSVSFLSRDTWWLMLSNGWKKDRRIEGWKNKKHHVKDLWML